MCVLVDIYFVLAFRVKSNLEAASDNFSEILLLSTSFSSCLALRHRKDQGMCPWTHRDWSEWLTRSEFRWSVLPASLHKPHIALPPQQHPHWHFLSPSSRSGSLGRSALCCGSGVTQVTSWFLLEQWQPIGKELQLHLGYFLAVSCCYNSLRRLEPTLGTSQSPAAREWRSRKVASSHLCSPIPSCAQPSQVIGENLGQSLWDALLQKLVLTAKSIFLVLWAPMSCPSLPALQRFQPGSWLWESSSL